MLRFVLKLLHDRVILGLVIEKRYDRGEKGGAGLLDLERERGKRGKKREEDLHTYLVSKRTCSIDMKTHKDRILLSCTGIKPLL